MTILSPLSSFQMEYMLSDPVNQIPNFFCNTLNHEFLMNLFPSKGKKDFYVIHTDTYSENISRVWHLRTGLETEPETHSAASNLCI